MICALIPAAGRGSRLGGGEPKIFLSLSPGVTVWDVLMVRLGPHVQRIHAVLSPEGWERARPRLSVGASPMVTASIQDPPAGMGDAIFGARAAWETAQTLLVVWGDQASLSSDTVARTLAVHAAGGHSDRLTIPLVSVDRPYVDYVFDSSGGLLTINQSREGDPIRDQGDSDVGVFCLSTDGLGDAWDDYAATAARGGTTGEVNFLPFLSHLSRRRGFSVRRVEVTDPGECRGINTQEDLAFFRRRAAAVGEAR